MADKNAPFAILPSDPRSVSSALSAAERAWRRGDRADVLRWVQRSAELARDEGEDGRAAELAKCAADLAVQVGSVPPRPTAGAIGPGPAAPAVHLLTRVKALRPAVTRVVPPDEAARKGDAKGASGPITRTRLPSFHDDVTNPAGVVQLGAEGARKKAPSRPDRSGVAKRPARGDDADGWTTEVLSASDSTGELPEADTPEPTAAAVSGTRTTQALRVRVWRTHDGTLRVVPAGLPAPPTRSTRCLPRSSRRPT